MATGPKPLPSTGADLFARWKERVPAENPEDAGIAVQKQWQPAESGGGTWTLRWRPTKGNVPTGDLKASRLAERAVAEGREAPDFRLESSAGGEVSLSELRARGPVVLTFFRGHW